MLRNLIVGAVVSLSLTACGSNQKIQVYLTDAPLEDATAVNITVHGLEAKGSGDKDADDSDLLQGTTDEKKDATRPGTVMFDEPRVINLLELRNGVRTLLGEVETDGKLGQLRLLMDGKATVVWADGSSQDANVPSGAQTGVKIVNIPDGASEITLDFDAAQSIHDTGDGDLVMRPTIRAMVGDEVVGETTTE